MQIKEANKTMLRDVIEGLSRPQKTLPSKYFYDEKGSELFEKITRLPAYYLTRAEKEIFQNNIDEITAAIEPESVLVELGSGSSKKTRFLLKNLPQLTGYIPVDISGEYLTSVEEKLQAEFPDIIVKAVCADYTEPFSLPSIGRYFSYYVFFYPGSTIGNFEPKEARIFLERLSNFMIPGGGLIVGVDLEKEPAKMEAAYNDPQGVTAAFNKNLLARLNRELSAGFNVDAFEHRAFYSSLKHRIEMHLVSAEDQSVHINGEHFSFKKDETIHTENSYKYSLDRFQKLVKPWFHIEKIWTDDEDCFSVWYLEAFTDT